MQRRFISYVATTLADIISPEQGSAVSMRRPVMRVARVNTTSNEQEQQQQKKNPPSHHPAWFPCQCACSCSCATSLPVSRVARSVSQ